MIVHQAGGEFHGTQLCHLCGQVLAERAPAERTHPFAVMDEVLLAGMVAGPGPQTHEPVTRFYRPGSLLGVTAGGELTELAWQPDGTEQLCNGDRLPFALWGWL